MRKYADNVMNVMRENAQILFSSALLYFFNKKEPLANKSLPPNLYKD